MVWQQFGAQYQNQKINEIRDRTNRAWARGLCESLREAKVPPERNIMMTDKQVEAAARELCQLNGIDAEELIYCGGHLNEDGTEFKQLSEPRLKFVIEQVREHERLDLALRYGRSQP